MGGQIGIFNGSKVYDPSFLTADITDEGGLVHFAQVRYMIGDYFLTPINKQIYAFKLDGSRIKTSKIVGAKSFRKIYFDTSHYKPISQANIKEIEIILNKNNLPKVNKQLLNVLSIFSKTEKTPFTIHDVTTLKSRLLEHEKRYEEEISELINFMASLDTDKIVTPLRKMVEFIEGDLKTVDAKYMGSIFTQATKMDEKSKRVLNPTLTAKKSWIVLILGMALIGTTIGMIWFANDAGAFDGLTGMIGNVGGVVGGVDYSDKAIMAKYPSGESLTAAVDSGAVDYDKLSNTAQAIVDDQRKK